MHFSILCSCGKASPCKVCAVVDAFVWEGGSREERKCKMNDGSPRCKALYYGPNQNQHARAGSTHKKRWEGTVRKHLDL